MGCCESKRLVTASSGRSRLLSEEIERATVSRRNEIDALVVGTKYSDKDRFVQLLIRYIGEQTNGDQGVDVPQRKNICHDITEICFTIFERKFRVLHLNDGVKAFKSKWIHCLDNVNVILVVVDMSQYNIHRSENPPEENFLLDSLRLYEEVCNHYFFRQIPIVLLFVNPDLLEQKLSQVPLSSGFPEFKGTDTFDEASAFITERFEAARVWKDARRIENSIVKSYHNTDDLLSVLFTIIDMCPLENARVECVNQSQPSICDEPLTEICLIALWYCLYCCCGPLRSRRQGR